MTGPDHGSYERMGSLSVAGVDPNDPREVAEQVRERSGATRGLDKMNAEEWYTVVMHLADSLRVIREEASGAAMSDRRLSPQRIITLVDDALAREGLE